MIVLVQFSCGSDDDDSPASETDDDDDTLDELGECAVVNVEVLPPPQENILSREIVVQTEIPCSLSGRVTSENLRGYGSSIPEFSAEGTEHRFRFYGLAETSIFHYVFHLASLPEHIVAQGDFETSSLPSWAPRPILVEGADLADRKTWIVVTASADSPPMGTFALEIIDRDGRLRFYAEPKYGTPKASPEGGFFHGGDEMTRIGLDGSMDRLFVTDLNEPYLQKFHHYFYVNFEPLRYMLVFNMIGSGVMCDLTTPTDMAVGDGVAELDEDGHEIWRWSAFDHQDEIPPDAMDPVSCLLLYGDLGEGTIDWTHANSAFPVPDEDAFLISMRNVSRVVKVNHNTGDILWQLGNDLDFTWEDDESIGYQHDAQIMENGNLILFDNHFRRLDAPWSRVIEVELDTQSWTAKIVWELRFKYNMTNGTVEKLSNGNTLISTGGSFLVIEADPEENEVWRATYDLGNFGDWPGPVIHRATIYPSIWLDE